MDFKKILDIIESFAFGLLIILIIAVFMSVKIIFFDYLLPAFPHMIKSCRTFLIIIFVILIGMFTIYLIGKIAKFPSKGISKHFTHEKYDKTLYCGKCCSPIKPNAKFCDGCGKKI